MKNEQEFYRNLSDIPEMPSDMYPHIDGIIRRRSAIRRTIFAIAAAIPLAIGILTVSINHTSRKSDVQTEVASELQIIHDYLNSSDLDSDLELYAVFEGY